MRNEEGIDVAAARRSIRKIIRAYSRADRLLGRLGKLGQATYDFERGALYQEIGGELVKAGEHIAELADDCGIDPDDDGGGLGARIRSWF